MRFSYCAAKPATRNMPGTPAMPTPASTKTPRSGSRSGLASVVPVGMYSSTKEGIRYDWPTLAWSVTPAGRAQDTPSFGENPTKGPAWSMRAEGAMENVPPPGRHSSCTEAEVTAQRGAWSPESAKERPTDADAASQWFPTGSVPSQLSEACHHL